jgi:ABC-type cobalamin/Fe3+-siderophores transport system ATPase subunit
MGDHFVAVAAPPARSPACAARVCGHALLLLYDSGRFRQGPTHEVLTQDHLEALYGCRPVPAAAAATPLYIPTS